MVYVDMNLVNTVFAIGLVIFSVSFVVFLFFFIPVLVQLTKTLEAIQTIASLLKEYSLTLNHKLNDASESFDKIKGIAINLCGSFLDVILNLIKKK